MQGGVRVQRTKAWSPGERSRNTDDQQTPQFRQGQRQGGEFRCNRASTFSPSLFLYENIPFSYFPFTSQHAEGRRRTSATLSGPWPPAGSRSPRCWPEFMVHLLFSDLGDHVTPGSCSPLCPGPWDPVKGGARIYIIEETSGSQQVPSGSAAPRNPRGLGPRGAAVRTEQALPSQTAKPASD